MKRLKIFFLILFGFLFVSIAEAKTDIQVNDGFEVVINTLDFDLVAIDYMTIETPANYGNYLINFHCIDIIINFQKQNSKLSDYRIKFMIDNGQTVKTYLKLSNIKNQRRLSNPGKLNLSVII